MAAPNAKFDWDIIGQEYIQGHLDIDYESGIKRHRFPTLKDLSIKYKCSEDAVCKMSSREQWVIKRELFRTKIRAKLEQNHVSALINESSKYDFKNISKVEQIHKLLDTYFAQYSLLTDPDDGTIILNEESPQISIKELETITKILKESHFLVRSIFNEPVTAHNNNLMEEIEELNNPGTKADSASRKARIKKLNTKLLAKEQAKQQLLEKKKQLEDMLKNQD